MFFYYFIFLSREEPQPKFKWHGFPPDNYIRPIQRSQSHGFVGYTLKTTDIPLDVTYNVMVGGYIPLSHNTLKGEPLDNE